jgi:MoxR-like ATPase
MTMKDLRAAQSEAAMVAVSDETIDALIQIRDACKAEGIVASDRRWKKSLKLAQAGAFMAGEKKTSPEDLSILVDSLWREPKERPKVARIVGKLADPVGAQAAEILDAARETAAKVAALVAGDRKAYIAQAAQALEQFQAQQKKLAQLAKGAGRRAAAVIQDSTDEIIALHTDLARTVSAGLGLRSARS